MHDCVYFNITGNSGRTTPHNLPLQRSLESISTIASDIVTTGYVF